MTPSSIRGLRMVTPAAVPLPDGPWLNVGSGPDGPEGWIHLDGSWQARLPRHPLVTWIGRVILKKEIGQWPASVRYCDVRKGLPAETGSVAVVYSSHMMEHLHRDEALRFLAEARRVLKQGGVLRVIVPDVAAIVGWYLDHQREPASARKTASSDLLMEMLMLRPRQAPSSRSLLGWLTGGGAIHEHKWMYDAEGLRALVVEAGFPQAEVRGHLESAIPTARLAGVEYSTRIENGCGVCVEARK